MGAALFSLAHLLSLVIAQFYRAIPVGLITVCIGRAVSDLPAHPRNPRTLTELHDYVTSFSP